MSTFDRPKLEEGAIDWIFPELKLHLIRALEKHGWGATVSTHEALGDVAEEFDELKDAVRSNEMDDVKSELLDVATAAIWAVMSMEYGHMDH